MRSNVVGYLCLVQLFATTCSAVADTADPGQALTSDRRGRIYLGGRFNSINAGGQSVPASNIARWEPTSKRWEALPGGSLVENIAGAGHVSAMTSDSAGEFVYVGGAFDKILLANGQLLPITNFARYNVSSESWESLATVSGTINEIRLEDEGGAVIVGVFTFSDGVESRNIVRWNGSDMEPVIADNLGPNNPGASGSFELKSVFVRGANDYLIGGNLPSTTIFDPPVCNASFPNSVEHLARMNGNLVPLCPLDIDCGFELNGNGVNAIEELEGTTFIGGNISSLDCGNGQSHTLVNNLARTTGDGVWEPLDDPNLTGDGVTGTVGGIVAVNDMVPVPNMDALIVAGQFVNAESLVVNSIALWDTKASVWRALQGMSPGPGVFFSFVGTPGRVNALHYDEQFNRVYVAGLFSDAGGESLGLLGGPGGIAYYELDSGGNPSLEGWSALTHNSIALDIIVPVTGGSSAISGIVSQGASGATSGEGVQEPRPSPSQTFTLVESGLLSQTVMLKNTSSVPQAFRVFLLGGDESWNISVSIDGFDFTDFIGSTQELLTSIISPGESATLIATFDPMLATSGETTLGIFGFDRALDGTIESRATDAIQIVVQLDCDDSAIADVVQIAADPSLDTNANSVLDSCDIADGNFPDLDLNGVPDVVDDAQSNQADFLVSQALPIPGLGVDLQAVGGDANGDGKSDITIVQRNGNGDDSVAVTKTDENGVLQPTEEECPPISDRTVNQVMRVDMDCDGKDDLIKTVTDAEGPLGIDETFLVVKPAGAGPGSEFAIEVGRGNLAIKDLNNDGKPDIAILNARSPGVVHLMTFENLGLDSEGNWQEFAEPRVKLVSEEAGDRILRVEIANNGTSDSGLPDLMLVSEQQVVGFRQDGPFVFERIAPPLSTNLNAPDAGSAENPEFKKREVFGNTDFTASPADNDDDIISFMDVGSGPNGQTPTRQIKVVRRKRLFDGTIRETISFLQSPFADPFSLRCNDLKIENVEPTPDDSIDRLFPEIIWTAIDANGQPVTVIFTNLGFSISGEPLGFSAGVPFNPDSPNGSQNLVSSASDEQESLSVREGASSVLGALPLLDIIPSPEPLLANVGPVPESPKFVFADVSGDGRADIVVLDHNNEMLTVHLNTLACEPNCSACASGAASGDTNGDGNVDLQDYADFNACMAGPGNGLGTGCECFDFDSDGDIDLSDFAGFQARMAP